LALVLSSSRMFLPRRASSEAINLDYWPTSQTLTQHQQAPFGIIALLLHMLHKSSSPLRFAVTACSTTGHSKVSSCKPVLHNHRNASIGTEMLVMSATPRCQLPPQTLVSSCLFFIQPVAATCFVQLSFQQADARGHFHRCRADVAGRWVSSSVPE
jgi:hypothetical protein